MLGEVEGEGDSVCEPVIDGVAVTSEVALIKGVTLGETPAVTVAVALPVVEPLVKGVAETPVCVRLGETETEALVVSVAPPLAAPLAAGEGVGDSGQGSGAQTEIVRTRLLLPSTVISCPCGESVRPPGPQMPAAAPTPSAYPCTAPPPASVATPPVVVHTARMLPPFCTYRLPDAASMARPCALL